MTDHTLLVLCIPVALAAGLLWGIAWEKHRASHRRQKDEIDMMLWRGEEEFWKGYTIGTALPPKWRAANERLSRSRPF